MMLWPYMNSYNELLTEVGRCTQCSAHLPYEPKPVIQYHPNARILIAGQAPGKKAHCSGVPFDDASGDRLREWMGISKSVFYDKRQVAILPMGFCYPGSGKTGDLPPRKECEQLWRKKLLAKLPNIEITLVLGKYAQSHHFGEPNLSLTQLVRSWEKYWPTKVPLPHPSPRNNIWLSKNRWFEEELVPLLQARIGALLSYQ